MQHYRDGADVEVWANIQQIYAKDADGKMAQALIEQAKRDVFYAAQPIYGSPTTVAAKLADLAIDGDLDALLLTFPDYIVGLERMDKEVKPEMERLGVNFSTTAAVPE